MLENQLNLVDVTDIFQDYRTCCRDIWNLYLHRDKNLSEWELLEDFENAKNVLFKVIVYSRSIARVEREVGLSGDVEFLVLPSIQSDFSGRGAPIRISEVEGPRGGSYWNQEPGYVLADEVVLSYVDVCDWGDTGFRDMALCRVEIKEIRGYPELVKRQAMLEAAHVRIAARPRRGGS